MLITQSTFTFNIFNFHIHDLCQNYYLSSPYISMETIRYKQLCIKTALSFSFPGLTKDKIDHSPSFVHKPIPFFWRTPGQKWMRYLAFTNTQSHTVARCLHYVKSSIRSALQGHMIHATLLTCLVLLTRCYIAIGLFGVAPLSGGLPAS